MIVIKSIKGLKFPLRDVYAVGYAHSTGLGFFDTETKEWVSGMDNEGSTEFPYIPVGGRNACEHILADSGDFFTKSPRVKSLCQTEKEAK